MWIKNTDGKKDAMLTFATFSFLAVTLNIILANIETITFGESTISFSLIDPTTMGVYLAATFSAYVGRKLTDKHYHAKNKEIEVTELKIKSETDLLRKEFEERKNEVV